MKKRLATLAAAFLLAGCVFKSLPEYTADNRNIEVLQSAAPMPVNVGFFKDESFREELTCLSHDIRTAPNNWTFADVMRYAIMDELIQADRYNPESPVTLSGRLDRIDFIPEKGLWIVRLTLISSNGKSLTYEQTLTYADSSFGPVACSRAASNYLPLLHALMSNLFATPEFAELCLDTPPPAITADMNDALKPDALTTDIETRALEKANERVRQGNSLQMHRGRIDN